MDRQPRAFSKSLVGGTYRLEIADASHSVGKPFTCQEIADATNIRYGRVQEDLKRLVAAQMLVALPREGLEVRYEAVASTYWQACQRLLQEARDGGSG